MHTVIVNGSKEFRTLPTNRIAEMQFDGFEIEHAKNCKGCK